MDNFRGLRIRFTEPMSIGKEEESSIKNQIAEHRRRLQEGSVNATDPPPMTAYMLQGEASDEEVA